MNPISNNLSSILLAALLVGSQTAPTMGAAGAKIAFIGDQGHGEDAMAVLRLIKQEQADLLLHQGDFDYQRDPEGWDARITEVLGADFPVLASLGNHDKSKRRGYQRVLGERLERTPEVLCTGKLTVRSTCSFRGIFMVFTAPGVKGKKRRHEEFIREELQKDRSAWRICSFHKNQAAMQVGGKSDATGWGVYEACLQGGAVVATGHEHSYARTHLMSSFENQTIASTDDIVLSPGRSFVIQSGLGGKSIRRQKRGGKWWASIYTLDQGAQSGALFCTFGRDGAGSCYFKDIAGRIPDSFSITSEMNRTKEPIVGHLNQLKDFGTILGSLGIENLGDPLFYAQ